MTIDRLRTIMARLRHPDDGCEWDKAQTFSTIAPYTIEEAYEVADAIEQNDLDALKDELGDLQLQVVFHSRMAEELGAFDLDDVMTAVSDKLERRHPHIFSEGGQTPGWEEIKASERQTKGHAGALGGVALGLPALLRAEKIQKRAARTGFDWPNANGPRAKILEEMAEVDQDPISEEVGDLLFAVVNWARHLGIDAEAALREATAKFEKRFAMMENIAGADFAQLSLDEKNALWDRAKAALKGRLSRS